MIPTFIKWLLKLGAGGIVERAITLIDKRAKLENDREKIRAELTAEYLRQVVEETRIMADYNKAKLSFPLFWVLVFAVAGPLILWEIAVVIDSIPYLRGIFGDQQVFDLPTGALQDAYAAMVKWVFYIGSGVAGFKAVIK
ncbi:hypothetical protein [uncultured Martelella sp.]|uniref:hypothetical protein n=1 Tax=uncultured Martelella sp. TaxID=392331 RepID=UPI0029C66B7E|nr:hypothetical protein [uncultured Martelella sp.]